MLLPSVAISIAINYLGGIFALYFDRHFSLVEKSQVSWEMGDWRWEIYDTPQLPTLSHRLYQFMGI
jgi:hypothetical protein